MVTLLDVSAVAGHHAMPAAVLFCCYYYFSANSTLLSLPRFSYFITPYDARASSAFSALIFSVNDLAGVVILK